jgi:hypothetical protein
MSQVLYALAAGVLALLSWRGLTADTIIAAAAVVALLFYPLAWPQYDISLLPVVAWVISRSAARDDRLALFALLIYVLVRALPDMTATPGGSSLGDILARNKTWLQVGARLMLLVAVIAASREKLVSASAPS